MVKKSKFVPGFLVTAAWTAKGLFGWKKGDWKFKMVFTAVLLIGAIVSSLSINSHLN